MIRCYGCGKEWTAAGLAHCKECHEDFGSTSAFDRHRTGTYARTDVTANQHGRRCIPVERFGDPMKKRDGSLGSPRLVLAARKGGGVWVTALKEGARA